MGKLINPATNKPFVEVNPDAQVIQLRRQIMKQMRMKYDSAQNTSQNQLHWSNADLLSPHAANSLSVRTKLRSRSRYETANNPYLKGIVLSKTNDIVGSGATLKITDPRFNAEQKASIETLWLKRSKKVKLRKKVWRLVYAFIEDGEGFSFKFTDRNLNHRVKVNQSIVECDQVSHFEASTISGVRSRRRYEVDGVRFNKTSGEASEYHLLDEHPGENLIRNMRPLDGRWIRANKVIHLFRQERGWLRGIPETTPTLPLWALLRRYTLAVVQNAEIAADFTVLLKSLQSASLNPFDSNIGDPDNTDPSGWFDSFPIDRGLMTVVPDGHDLEQLDPAQPVSTYDSFVNALVQEASRPLLVPKNHALGSSGDFNMASANLDRQIYRESIRQFREDLNDDCLDRDLEQWWFEAIRTPGYFLDEGLAESDVMGVVARFQSLRDDPPDHTYRWDEVPEHVDPVKWATALNILHMGGHISDSDIQEGRFNRPVKEHYDNLESQNEWRNENGMPVLTMEEAVSDASDTDKGNREDEE